MARLSVLCLVGSSTTPEMAELSELYASGAIESLEPLHDFGVLYLSPDGSWRHDVSIETAKAAPALSFAEGVKAASDAEYDIGLPQMFCPFGMTAGRAGFELMDLPFIGNDSLAMGLTADKAKARAIVAAAGLAVPEGIVVRSGERPENIPPLPVIVKPVAGDNSDGLSLVREAGDLAAALERAGDEALVERFIPPGRELRCGVIERNGNLFCLPPEEYPVDAFRPVRTKADKLARSDDGTLRLAAKTADASWIITPDDPIIAALHDAARTAYAALGCRHYGLFDFRVDDDGTPWFLEAGLYCSFSPQSVIAVMARAAGIPLPDLFNDLAQHTLGHPSNRPSRTAA